MADQQKGRIFISYRRADSAGYAGRIYDRLVAHFGEDAIFMDVDTIEAGVDFVEVLQNAVQACDVLIALIGRSWINIKDETGKRRLDNSEDFVRIEIAAALERDIRVIPVLVDGAPMPRSTELPGNLKPLARRNALQVDHHSFNLDAQRLISQLELALSAAERAKAEKARREQKAREKKAAEEKRAQEAAVKAAREKEERERKEREEKARKEKEAREKSEAEEKAQKAARRKQRQKEFSESIKNIFRGRRKLPFYIGGGIVILFLLGYIIKSAVPSFTPSEPTESSETPALQTSASPKIPPTPTPAPGIGNTMVSPIDGMTMVFVPAGEFQMGSEDGEDDEKPVHTVYLDAFWIDHTEVTNTMYARCVEAGACGSFGSLEYDDHPAAVLWQDANNYCEWVNRRLPTEAEWEKAARGTDKRMYPWGNAIDDSYANYSQNVGGITSVGSYEKGVSFYGAYDMAGNALEWVADWYDENYYSISLTSNPLGSNSGEFRVARGGSWYEDDYDVRSARRFGLNPLESYLNILGFRCAYGAASEPTDTTRPEVESTEIPEELGVGSTIISEKDGMAMVYVPAGDFQMGSEDGYDDEKPVHTVYLGAYWIDQTEVTNAMYAKCVDAGECDPPSSNESFNRESYYGNPSFGDYPVIYISWNDAFSYCEWAGRRLPSEAEWEKAAGWDGDTGVQRVYPWGNTFDGTKINFCDTNCGSLGFGWKDTDYDDGYADTAPVGNYPTGASFYGALDMAGNVSEWVNNWYDVYPGGDENVSEYFGKTHRVVRGGKFFDAYYSFYSTDRSYSSPTDPNPQRGFRCSRSP